ncbi:MAG: hypothetical protein II625_07675, partial [Bacilli bacterium]|nr:hypothetical protein [Bacilli bacterium]
KDDRLQEEYKDILAIVDKESYKFKLNDVTTVISNRYFQRENEEYKFKLDFMNNEASFYLKTHKQLLPVKVEELSYNRTEKDLTVIYKIETDEEKFKIFIEEKED